MSYYSPEVDLTTMPSEERLKYADYFHCVNSDLKRFSLFRGAFTEIAELEDKAIWMQQFEDRQSLLPPISNMHSLRISEEERLVQLHLPRQYAAIYLERELLRMITPVTLVERVYLISQLDKAVNLSSITYLSEPRDHYRRFHGELDMISQTPILAARNVNWTGVIRNQQLSDLLLDANPVTIYEGRQV